ncbi:MAG TPA: four helix bundle protein [Tepidisphaeraceae bacterium]|jgi:four helix bundle protein
MLNDEQKTRDLKVRTKEFALRIIRLYSALSKRDAAGVIGRQLLRSGTSVGAQYREAARARSPAEFISKMQSATQELDETAYWMELLQESGVVEARLLRDLQSEAEELTRVFVASVKTAKSKTKGDA